MKIDNIVITPVMDESIVIGVTVTAPPGHTFDLSKTGIQGNRFQCFFIQNETETD